MSMQCKMETINKMCNEWANYGNALRKCGKTQEKQRQSRGKESLIKCQICQVDCQNQAPAHEYRYQRYMEVDENILWHFTLQKFVCCVCVCVCGRLFPVSLYNCETQMKRILSLCCAFVEYPIQSKRHKNFTLNLLHCRQQ